MGSCRPALAVSGPSAYVRFRPKADIRFAIPTDTDLGAYTDCGCQVGNLARLMAEARTGNPVSAPAEWARRCHIEAARAIHPATRAFLLELAAEYEAIAGETVNLDPDDIDLQSAVADRLAALAAKRREWMR